MKEAFGILVSKSYAYNAEEQQSSPSWTVVRALYEHNYVFKEEKNVGIPKKIHQIWLGGDIPAKYDKFTESWRKFNPTWEYRLWTDNDVDNILMTNRRMFDIAQNKGMKSDILRYEILRQQGGMYVDVDFECLKPFDDLVYLDFFTGIAYDGRLVLYMGLIATAAHHPIIEACVSDMDTDYTGNNSVEIMDATGPYYFTKRFLSVTDKTTKGVVAFPMEFFYPWPNNLMGYPTPYDFVTPNSYAIHHWDVSWIKK
jgi:inositol phosphorylceramide mannosyltransferase catalytic subunit